MSSGLRYVEQSLPLPWGDDIDTYYGTDLRDLALNGDGDRAATRVSEWLYNNYNPLLLGLVLERATGTSVSDYMATRLWQPLGAEADATWSLDSEDSGFEKMESGLNAAPVDYARFGHLFLHGGEWNGTRIVSQDWVRARPRRRHERRPGGALPVLLVGRHRAARTLLRPGQLRAVHLRGPRRRCRHRSERCGLGSGERRLARSLP